jgi:hypothetical protein
MFYSFDDYWRNFGRYQHEVICNPALEQVFHDFAEKIWDDAYGTDEETYEIAHIEGYECCERENNLIGKEDKK